MVSAAWFLVHQIAQKILQVTLSTVTKVQSVGVYAPPTGDITATHSKWEEKKNFLHLQTGHVIVVHKY